LAAQEVPEISAFADVDEENDRKLARVAIEAEQQVKKQVTPGSSEKKEAKKVQCRLCLKRSFCQRNLPRHVK
jgi:hypothetical protein